VLIVALSGTYPGDGCPADPGRQTTDVVSRWSIPERRPGLGALPWWLPGGQGYLEAAEVASLSCPDRFQAAASPRCHDQPLRLAATAATVHRPTA
jgi:hypothetical protein